ncbi:MAG: AsmA family protein, partial [Phycisphaerales bacterium]|nr:AsmA family protein [Phycisphaerales bacterium]
MKTALKILAVLFVLLIVLVVGVVIFAISNINGLVKTGIEKGGTYATGSMTTVENVDVGIFGGTMSMNTLEIANPSGFTTPFFFELGSADVRADWASYNEPKIHVPRVKLSGIQVYLDKGANPSNYNTILNHIKSLEGGSGSGSGSGGTERSVLIDSLVLEDINIHVANMPGVSFAVGD